MLHRYPRISSNGCVCKVSPSNLFHSFLIFITSAMSMSMNDHSGKTSSSLHSMDCKVRVWMDHISVVWITQITCRYSWLICIVNWFIIKRNDGARGPWHRLGVTSLAYLVNCLSVVTPPSQFLFTDLWHTEFLHISMQIFLSLTPAASPHFCLNCHGVKAHLPGQESRACLRVTRS